VSTRRPDLRHLIQIPKYLGHRPGAARPIRGTTPSGEAVDDALTDEWTLLMFLSTTCDGCQELWDACADPDGSFPADVRVLVVTRESDSVDTLAQLGRTARVVRSDATWPDYGVHSGPFFALVERGERIATEGVAWSPQQITDAVNAARRA